MDLFQKKFLIPSRRIKLKKETQLLYLSRLLRLLKNGYSLLDALDVMKWDNQMVEPTTIIVHALKNGNTLDEAFEQASFNQTITTYLYFVRVNGDIQASLEKCTEMFQQRIEFTAKFQQTIRYPLVLLVIFSILLYFVKNSILPSFSNLFSANNETSSTISLSLAIIDMFGTFIWISIISVFISLLIWKFIRHKISIQDQIKLYQRIPIYRNYKRIQTSFLFATHFSSLLKTGISIKDILTIMSNQKQLPILSYYSILMMNELNRGHHISYLLSQSFLLEKQIAHIFQKNADIHALEKDLKIYAGIITEELNHKVTKAITYIQPVFFVLLAGFIVLIYTTLMWPMFQLIKTI
ncbi:competence type IV pilus assembly protein ComGB [Virgibacillus necropolis]|uniref:Chromosome partitioning protein ParA n=1 Tax=Virgibacillus necropolis TaxID=163877 RepID=A0A221MC89_9BACI|nr:competence type IV pilus assembly protein ComGB [Virgibacillus necropolis]ASN05247.1 chromosome partitioning protein ParA [Virgibacillus necropolis]